MEKEKTVEEKKNGNNTASGHIFSAAELVHLRKELL